MICASLGRVELHLGRRMPRAELLWPVHYMAYAQRSRTVSDGAGEQSTGYSADPIWCRPRHSVFRSLSVLNSISFHYSVLLGLQTTVWKRQNPSSPHPMEPPLNNFTYLSVVTKLSISSIYLVLAYTK